MNVKERLLQFIELKHLNQRKFQNLAGLPEGFVNNAKGTIRKKSIEKIINSFPDLNIAWVLTGEGEMLKSYSKNLNPDLDLMYTVPYYPDLQASAGLDFITDNTSGHSIPIKIPGIDVQAFINVFGDSMYPKYCSGEIIGIKQIEKEMVFFGNAYVIEMIDGEAYIKYIDPGRDEEHWTLRSENSHYKERHFHLSKIRKVFLIKAVITKTTMK